MFTVISYLIFTLGLGILLGGLSGSFLVGAIVSVILGIILVCVGVRENNRRFCKRCKRKYDFENDISYRQVGHKVKTYNFNPNSSSAKQLRSKEIFEIEVQCHCPQCQSSKTFTSNWTGRMTYYDGSIKDYDPELNIQKFFNRGAGSIGENLLAICLGIIFALVGLL